MRAFFVSLIFFSFFFLVFVAKFVPEVEFQAAAGSKSTRQENLNPEENKKTHLEIRSFTPENKIHSGHRSNQNNPNNTSTCHNQNKAYSFPLKKQRDGFFSQIKHLNELVLISIQLKLTKENKQKKKEQIKESTNAIDLEHSVKRKVTTKNYN